MAEKYDIFILGYDRNLNKTDSFYDDGLPINIIDGVNPILLGSGDLAGNISLEGGYMQSSNFVTGTSGWQLTPTSGEMNFAISVQSINIPDTTTASSFHTDEDGNSWWGCNVADFVSDNDNATSYILKTGVAKFQSAIIRGTLNADDLTVGSLSVDRITAGSIVSSKVGSDLTDTNITSIDFDNISATNISATNITTGTLTGRTVQTASSGERVVMGGGDTVIKFYGDSSNQGTIGFDGDNLYLLNLFDNSNLLLTVGTNSDIALSTFDSDGTILLGIGGSQKMGISSTGVAIGNGTLAMNSNKITGLATPTSTYDASTKKYVDDNVSTYTDADARGAINDVIGSDGHLDATLDCDGYDIIDVDLLTVDEITMLASPYKIAGSYTSIEFETSASSSGGITITGAANGTTVSGPLKLNSYLKLYSHNGTPGTASSYTGYLYYDTGETTLVFSNGSDWYKVTAEKIV